MRGGGSTASWCKGRNLRPGEAQQWTRDFFHALGLHRLRGTLQYPEAA